MNIQSFYEELNEILKTAAEYVPPALRQQVHAATVQPIKKGKSAKTMGQRMETAGTEEYGDVVKQQNQG